MVSYRIFFHPITAVFIYFFVSDNLTFFTAIFLRTIILLVLLSALL